MSTVQLGIRAWTHVSPRSLALMEHTHWKEPILSVMSALKVSLQAHNQFVQ